MSMKRSVSCAERTGDAYAPAATDLRCYSASYVTSDKPAGEAAAAAVEAHPKVKRTTSASSWSRPGSVVQRSGSTKTVSSGGGGRAGPTPGFNLRSYSASYAASYSPFEDAKSPKSGGGAVGGAAATWSAANRRSVNLRGYTPSFSALDDTADGPPIPAKKAPPPAAPGDVVFDDAELQRRKRLVAYKAYDVEGKMKDSVRRSFNWIKGKCSRTVYGL
ncbi:hypothetical protein GUJ93_ZPchr0002g25416 [Zizania palustris]|uniref:Uncharacterized protein n=1 Tax=Zizania palustris TaxID=103762 RepID=A0A8J5RQA2_ZIZPA|nr:hypothetical protein GUJ93_ZPchr0002g25416 [Zizania palustris]